ncbi:carbohydrate binding domain-containing protein [Winogradskyella sp. 3972H.M.0a.05]|uniref:carbohydrate binding domain-containing protein n=1 Tax=Winogradskyella sp. 3972H.M.0a.05 TaxID=2950277 RepID=UPI00339A84DD
MKKFITNNNIIWLFILAPFFFGCEDDDDAIVVADVVASFVHTINEDTGMVSFNNLSENADSYSWDFGDGTSSELINPEKTYPTGTYTVVLTATNSSGSDTFEDEIVINIPLPINFPVNFDDPNVSYDVSTFGGASFAVVENPDPSGTNPDVSNVGAVTNIGAAFEGFFFDLGVPLDLSVLQSVKVNFWSNTPIDVLMKLEEGTEGNIETTASHGGTGWEEIVFTFSSSASYSRIVFFVDGPGTTAGTFYFDDITQVETPPDPCTPDDMQSLDASDFNLSFETDPTASIMSFDVGFSWIDNPDFMNSVNTSCKVGQIDRSGAALFANNQIDFDSKFDFTTNSGFKLKVWSPNAGTNVLVKLEDKTNPAINTEVPAVTTVASGWEELTFDFPGSQSNLYDKIILFFELNTNTTETYYIDDFMLYGTGSGGGGGPFDDGLLTNGDFEDGTTAWSGNALNVLTEGGNSFNFANVMTAGNPFDVNLSQVVSITQGETYELSFKASSDVNRTMVVGIGLNEAPWTANTQVVNLTPDQQTFTLTLEAADFGIPNSRVLFDMGADVGVVVIDDVALFLEDGGGGGGGGGGGTGDNIATNGDFETGDDTGWMLFPNGGTATLDNSMNNGGAWSGRIVVGESGGNPGFKQERIGQGTVAAGDVIQLSFDHIGTISQPGAVVNVLLFGEGSSEVSFTHVFNPGPDVSGSWQTFTGTFTIPNGADVSEGISFLIEGVCGAVAGCGVTMNIDNVSVIVNPE